MATLKEMFDVAKDISRKVFEKDGYHSPLFLLSIPSRGGLGLCPMSWQDNDEKRAMLAELKSVFRKEGGDAYVGIVESWLAVCKPEEWEKDKTPPSERPDRKECLMIFGEDSSGARMLGQFPITRNKDNKPILGEFDSWDSADNRGDILMMDGMFQPVTRH